MAEKKGLSYGPNEALIRGAAAIGESKLPADMSGLDKITQAGMDFAKDMFAKRQEINKKLDDAAEENVSKAGGLGESMYSFAVDQTQKYKKEYLRGLKVGGPEGEKIKMQAMNNMTQLGNFAAELKEVNQVASENWLKGEFTENLNDEDRTVLQKVFKNDFEVSEDGDFIIKDDDGNTYTKTYEEYKDLTNRLKNVSFNPTYVKEKDSINQDENYWTTNPNAANDFRGKIMQDVPTTEQQFNDFLADEIQGNTFKKLLEKDENLEAEFDSELQKLTSQTEKDNMIKLYDTSGDGKVSKEEIIDAATNPNNDAYDFKNTRELFGDKMTAAAENEHIQRWKEINKRKEIALQKQVDAQMQLKERDGINVTGRGFITFEQFKDDYNNIKNNKLMIYRDNKQTIIFTYSDDKKKYVDGEGNTYTKEDIRNILQIPSKIGPEFPGGSSRATSATTTPENKEQILDQNKGKLQQVNEGKQVDQDAIDQATNIG